jgi:UDP:flavonoid glycosyltransferase YjiC (YdhE family)
MLCLPQAFDQRKWAGVVESAGGAEVLTDHSPGAIREAAQDVMHDDALRARVNELRRSLLAYDGERVAAAVVEELLDGG